MLNTVILRHLKECQVNLECAYQILNDLAERYQCHGKIHVAIDAPKHLADSQAQVIGYLALIEIYLKNAKSSAGVIKLYDHEVPEHLQLYVEYMDALEALEYATHRALQEISIETRKIKSDAICYDSIKTISIEGFDSEIENLLAAIKEIEKLIYEA